MYKATETACHAPVAFCRRLLAAGVQSLMQMLMPTAQTRVQVHERLTSRERYVPAFLIAQALCQLALVDVAARFGLKRILNAVTRVKVVDRRDKPCDVPQIVEAVRRACMFYIKRAHCLQRSAAVTRMLRRRGVKATLVIGYMPVPLRSHAWVEVNGEIVSDRTKSQDFYRVVGRW